jgi:uncharacterized protein YneF (UPF0154 family)
VVLFASVVVVVVLLVVLFPGAFLSRKADGRSPPPVGQYALSR